MYYFDQDPMYREGDRRYGHRSPHGQDVDFVFQSVRPGNNPTDLALAKYILKYWTNFAKYCNPNGNEVDSELPVWPLFKNENSQVMVLTGEGPHPAPVASEKAMWVLDEYFSWRRTQEPITGVIITGQNNHNWPVSHQAIKMTLENSGLFRLDVAVSPSQGKDMSDFSVDFTKYGLVVLDYNGDNWSAAMNAAFADYVRGGGGVVVYHAADNAFTDWKEYNEMIALGGWGGRNETSGPYFYWKDGALQEDHSPGTGGSHGSRHEYVLDCRSASHPITEGLPAQWKHASDELYDRMRGPRGIKDLLYTAFSSPSQRGSGRDEPLVFTVEYGKGRVFHIMLGHCGNSLDDNPAMQCAGFQTLLLRGAEWCATGKVSQPVPKDFPTTDRVSLRPNYRPGQ